MGPRLAARPKMIAASTCQPTVVGPSRGTRSHRPDPRYPVQKRSATCLAAAARARGRRPRARKPRQPARTRRACSQSGVREARRPPRAMQTWSHRRVRRRAGTGGLSRSAAARRCTCRRAAR
eukprot:4884318-Prymnesium_polylepis.1